MTYLWAHPSCMLHLHFSAPFLWTFFTSHTGQLQPCKDSDQSYIKLKKEKHHKIQVSKRPLTSQKCAFFVNILSTRHVKHCLMPIFQWNRLSCRLRSSLQTSRLLICVVSQIRKLRQVRQGLKLCQIIFCTLNSASAFKSDDNGNQFFLMIPAIQSQARLMAFHQMLACEPGCCGHKNTSCFSLSASSLPRIKSTVTRESC